ncbi:MAG TPA: hypothetical protein PKM48_07990, partial [Parvularculaceae bacterium]|nr:hypothetical protein [Parvularculaceae bacterium]
MTETGGEESAMAAVPDRRVRVLFPMPLARAYDYLAPEGVSAGDWVEAPFGGRMAIGVVWPGAADDVPTEKLKRITGRFDAAPLAPAAVDFVDWVAAYTMHPLGAVLRLVMRSGDALDPPAGVAAYLPTGETPARLTEARRAAMSVFDGGPLTVREIAARSG